MLVPSRILQDRSRYLSKCEDSDAIAGSSPLTMSFQWYLELEALVKKVVEVLAVYLRAQ